MLTMRKGLQTLEFSFEGEALTHFGGLFLIQRFCNQLHLRRRLQRIGEDAQIKATDVQTAKLGGHGVGMPHIDEQAGDDETVVAAENPLDVPDVTVQQFGFEITGGSDFGVHPPASPKLLVPATPG